MSAPQVVFIMLIPEVFWYLTDCSAAPFLPHVCAACSGHFGTKDKAEVAFKTERIPDVSMAWTLIAEEKCVIHTGVHIMVWPHGMCG